mmetsp:Transcript_31371/g.51912  ORF Transcript_31371/g.51912 Transcript_31371/m.51912 type:complete len:319 (+) Transcript_31371:693-1649(+)
MLKKFFELESSSISKLPSIFGSKQQEKSFPLDTKPQELTTSLLSCVAAAPTNGSYKDEAQSVTVSNGAANANCELSAVLRAEEHAPYVDILALVLVLLASFVLSVLRGRSHRQSLLGISCGSMPFWALMGIQFAVILVASVCFSRVLLKRYERKLTVGYLFLEDDVHWTPRKTIVWMLRCTVAGLVAGMFGIGGGIVKGPLMLEMGMLPVVSSATSSFMILFTSAAAASQYALFGALRPHYGAMMFCIGFVGTICGQWGLGYLLTRWKKQSLIVLVIALVIGISAVMMGIIGVINFLQGLDKGEYQGFQSVCGRTDNG